MRLSVLAGQAFARLGVWSYKNPLWVLLIVLVSTGTSIKLASKIKIDADVAAVLPESFQSVQALRKLKERLGGTGYVAVVGRSAKREKLRQFADEVAPLLSQLPSIKYVDFKRPVKFFEEHGLYYLELEDLDDLLLQLEDRANYERKKANPLLVDLEDEGPPEIEIGDLKKKYAKDRQAEWAVGEGDGYFYRRRNRCPARQAKRLRD